MMHGGRQIKQRFGALSKYVQRSGLYLEAEPPYRAEHLFTNHDRDEFSSHTYTETCEDVYMWLIWISSYEAGLTVCELQTRSRGVESDDQEDGGNTVYLTNRYM